MSNPPRATYTSPETSKTFSLENVHRNELSSDGSTTGPSPYLLESTNGQYVDKDKPAPLDDSEMGTLRGYVTRLQDDINVYLTQRIKASGAGVDAEDADDAEEDEEDGEDEEDEA